MAVINPMERKLAKRTSVQCWDKKKSSKDLLKNISMYGNAVMSIESLHFLRDTVL